MSEQMLKIEDIHATVAGREILKGINLDLKPGEIKAIMGPNGSGKSTLSHVIMGRRNYQVTSGKIYLGSEDITRMPTFERARRGIQLISQYPTEVPGVTIKDVIEEASLAMGRDESEEALTRRIESEADLLGFPRVLLDRWVNTDLSGGEKKRSETLQLGLLPTKVAVLDEIDSGLDIDALRAVARRIRDISLERGIAVLAITHYARLLKELQPSQIMVLAHGQIVAEGGMELAAELEASGYIGYGENP